MCETDSSSAVGKPTNIDGELILPQLFNGKIQMFYIVTDNQTLGKTVRVPEGSEDYITYFDDITEHLLHEDSVTLYQNQLYWFFGINKEWRIFTMNIAKVHTSTGIVSPEDYSIQYYI